MSLAIETIVDCPNWNGLGDLDALIEASLRAAVEECGTHLPEGAEVSLLFCDDARIRELNRQFRGQDKPTNVLSFPGPLPFEKTGILGDIAIAYETLAREAREQDKTLDRHCRHMIVHGFLHLLGYDHRDDREAEAMEAIEIRVLRRLGVENPYRYGAQEEMFRDDRV